MAVAKTIVADLLFKSFRFVTQFVVEVPKKGKQG